MREAEVEKGHFVAHECGMEIVCSCGTLLSIYGLTRTLHSVWAEHLRTEREAAAARERLGFDPSEVSRPEGVERVEYGVRFCNETQAEDLFDSVVEAEQCVEHIRKLIREDEYDPDDYEPIEIIRRTVTEYAPSISEWVSLPAGGECTCPAKWISSGGGCQCPAGYVSPPTAGATGGGA